MGNLSLSHFAYENVTFLWEYDVIIGDSLPKFGETPRKSRFWLILSSNVHTDNQTECNDTCFVENFI